MRASREFSLVSTSRKQNVVSHQERNISDKPTEGRNCEVRFPSSIRFWTLDLQGFHSRTKSGRWNTEGASSSVCSRDLPSCPLQGTDEGLAFDFPQLAFRAQTRQWGRAATLLNRT